MECHCYLRNVQDLSSDGQTPHERRFEEKFRGSNVSRFEQKTRRGCIKLARKYSQASSCAMFYVREEVGKETSSQQTSKHYRRTTHPKSKENGTKEVLVPNEGDNFIFHFLTVPRSWHEKVLKSEHLTDFGKTSKMEKNSAVIFKEKRTIQILQSNNENKANWKQYVIFGLILEASFLVIMCKTDKNCMCHREARFRSHSSILMRATLDVLQEFQNDYWIFDGDRILLSRQWTRFTQFTVLNTTPPKGYTWSVGRLTKIQTSSRPEDIWPEIWSSMSEKDQQKEKQHWAEENPKFDTKGGRKWIWTLQFRANYERAQEINPWRRQRMRWTLARRDPLLSPLREKGSRVYQEAHTRDSKQRSRRSHCRRWRRGSEFCESLKSCAPTYSFAPGNEDSMWVGRRWQIMG